MSEGTEGGSMASAGAGAVSMANVSVVQLKCKQNLSAFVENKEPNNKAREGLNQVGATLRSARS